MASVVFNNFSFQYDNLKKPTLKNIQLTIEEGEKVLLAGPSGSGKSTLAHCMNGLIPRAYAGNIQGELLVAGEPLGDKPLHEISKLVGTILQDADGQFVALSVGEDVAFAFENDSMPKEDMVQKVRRILNNFQMEDFEHQSPQNLSGGQKQKVAMAGVLAMNAPILLFDEPLANLDPMSGKLAMDTIDSLHQNEGKTILVVEHRIEDVLAHNFDRIVIVAKGEIVFNGSPDEALRTGILTQYGLREPLYIETLKNIGIDISEEKHLTSIASLKKFKATILTTIKEKTDNYHQAVPKETLLTCQNLTFRYAKEDRTILKNLSFEIKKEEFLAILGNNGAGKSTLLKVLTGFGIPEQGKIIYEGQDITKASIRKRAQSIGYVMQNPNHMITQYMIYDEIAFGLRNFGYSEEEVKERVEEILEVCGLAPFRNWPIMSLSFGQKKRVTIASILAMRPKIIVLDEPTAGQDHRNYTEFMGFLNKLRAGGITVVMITHDMQLALEYADRAIVLSGGEVIDEDSIYNVLAHKEILAQANLKETSIGTLADLFEIKDKSNFLRTVVEKGKAVKENE